MQIEDLHPLPAAVVELLREFEAPPRLLAHLVLVHDVAARLIDALLRTWPRLSFDADAVSYGAATHDIGKVLYPKELTEPAVAHAAAGQHLLEERGVRPEQARYARTHESWSKESDVTFEDLLVVLADHLWRGERDAAVEQALTVRIAKAVGDAPWAVFMDFDDIASALADDGPRRLSWLRQFRAPGE